MEHGTVKHVTKNLKGHQIGFLELRSGEEIYIHELGGIYRLNLDNIEPRFLHSWNEMTRSPAQSSAFPKVGDTLYFEREVSRTGRAQRASHWCSQADYAEAERLIRARCVPPRAQLTWNYFGGSLITFREHALAGNATAATLEGIRIVDLVAELIQAGVNMQYLGAFMRRYTAPVIAALTPATAGGAR